MPGVVADEFGESCDRKTVFVFAAYAPLRASQCAILRSQGYAVEGFSDFESLLDADANRAVCLSIDLHSLDLTPDSCLRTLHRNDIFQPTIILSNLQTKPVSNKPVVVQPLKSAPAYVLWQPVDVELYLSVVASFVRRTGS